MTGFLFVTYIILALNQLELTVKFLHKFIVAGLVTFEPFWAIPIQNPSIVLPHWFILKKIH